MRSNVPEDYGAKTISSVPELISSSSASSRIDHCRTRARSTNSTGGSKWNVLLSVPVISMSSLSITRSSTPFAVVAVNLIPVKRTKIDRVIGRVVNAAEDR